MYPVAPPLAPMAGPIPIVVHPPKQELHSRRPRIIAPRKSKNKLDSSLQKSNEGLSSLQNQIPRIKPPESLVRKSIEGNPRFRRVPHSSRPTAPQPLEFFGPQTPEEAIKKYSAELTPYEMTEILKYPEIYYVGKLEVKTPDFDDKNHYKIHIGDHLAYRFEIQSVLGAGAFGQVVQCLDHKTNITLAVKVIINTPQMQEQGKMEGQILAKLNHAHSPNIVRAFDYFIFRNHICLTYELLGKNLHTFNQFPMATFQLKSLAVQLLKALDTCHRCSIIHCDLKPENILQQQNTNNYKIIDFGSSCCIGQQKYMYIQSRFYRAPEVILGIPYGPPMDIWSLGVIIVEMVIGKPLFNGVNELEQLSKMIDVLGYPPLTMLKSGNRRHEFFDQNYRLNINRPQRNSSLKSILNSINDITFVDFISKCLTWDPSQRLTAGQGLRHPWIVKTDILPDLK